MTLQPGALALLASSALAAPAAAQCVDFASGFGGPGPSNKVEDYETFQGELFAAGWFARADGLPVGGVATWSGTEWSPVGGGTDGLVFSLGTFDAGGGEELYASGNFKRAGGVPVGGIARWNGAQWSPLEGSNGRGLAYPNPPASYSIAAFDLAEFDDGAGSALFAGGFFSEAGGLPVQNLARWDGAEWADVSGTPTSRYLQALEVFDDGSGEALFVSVRNTVLADNAVWKFDGSAWTHYGLAGVEISDLAVFDDGGGEKLYASERRSGTLTSSVFRRDSTGWTVIGETDPNGYVFVMETWPDDPAGPSLWIGGLFASIDNLSTGPMARWDGSSWSATAVPINNQVHALEPRVSMEGPGLFVGGRFSIAGNLELRDAAQYDGFEWSAMGSEAHGLDAPGKALAAYDDGSGEALFVGGEFASVAGVTANYLARWDGAWSALPAEPDDVVKVLLEHDDGSGSRLVAAGPFQNVGATPASRIASWDGTAWTALADGFAGGQVWALAEFDAGSGPQLIAGGGFTASGPTPINGVAAWDGASWSALGGGVTGGAVRALVEFDDGGGPALYAGGVFTMAGGQPAAHIARWDGTSWSAVGGGVDDVVRALHVHDDGSGAKLYAGGIFTNAGGVPATGLAAWDGSSWSAVGTNLTVLVSDLTTFDDGTGSQLYAAGTSAPHVQRWNGETWSPIGGVDWEVRELAAYDDGSGPGLFMTGEFTRAGEVYSENIARYGAECVCPPTPYCTAGTTSSGCQAIMGAAGIASRSASGGFSLFSLEVEGAKLGLIYWGLVPKANAWGTGSSFQCVALPAQRTGTQDSGGSPGTCDGLLSLDFNAWMTENPGKAPPAGSLVYAQAWFRDPGSPKGTSFSDGVHFPVCP